MEKTKGYLLQIYLMSLLKYKIAFRDCEETYVGEFLKRDIEIVQVVVQ